MQIKKIIFIIFTFFSSFPAQIIHTRLITPQGLDLEAKIDNEGNVYTVWVSLDSDVLKYCVMDKSLNALVDSTEILDSRISRTPAITISDSIVNFVWRDLKVQYSQIKGMLLNVRSNIYSNQIIYSEPYGDHETFSPKISSLNDTTYLVLWKDSGSHNTWGKPSIYGQFCTNNLEFIGNNFLPNKHDESPTNVISRNPKILSFPNLNEVITFWIDNYAGREQVYAQKFSASGNSIGSIVQVTNDASVVDLFSYDVVTTSDSNFAIAWSTDIGGELVINLRWFSKDCLPISDIINVNDQNSENIYYSDLSINANKEGNVIVAWESYINENT